MNNTKVKFYFIANLIVWSLVIIRGCLWNPKLPDDLPISVGMNFNPKLSVSNDTFSIQPSARDPFLGILTSKDFTSQKKVSINKVEEVYIPILYHGSIAKEDSKDIVYIVTIENIQYFMKPGQVLKDIKLLKGAKESILVKYNGTTKTITKL